MAKREYLKRAGQQKNPGRVQNAMVWEEDNGANSMQLIGSHQVGLLGKYYYHNPRENLRKNQARERRRRQKMADQERSQKK